MEYIAHRINTAQGLKDLDPRYGVEVDIRSNGDVMYIHHDPFCDGEIFEQWVRSFKHGTLILNVKEEGLEQRLLDVMSQHGIDNFFFLDQSFPFLVKWSKKGLNRAAVRVSEFENIETALTLKGKVDWVWVDCFTRFPITGEEAIELKTAGFKLCLVSPELQGRDAKKEIPELYALLQEQNICAEAVCTKRPDIWESLS